MKSYVLCIDDGGYPESLEVRKVYQVVPDESAAEQAMLRVIDETGEDYLYSARLFVPILLPPEAIRVLSASPTDNNSHRNTNKPGKLS
ncbi:MAG TPA: hypothetical protein VJ023_04485 [Pyrinomonadaceae bacterium]|nr:hypothetical protein [Pyrinomonadaceae bacterium]